MYASLLFWIHITIQSKTTITLLLITWPNDNWPNGTQRWPLRERSIMNARPGNLHIIKLFAINSFPSSIHFVLRKFHSSGAHRKQEIAKRLQRANALSVSYAFTLVNAGMPYLKYTVCHKAVTSRLTCLSWLERRAGFTSCLIPHNAQCVNHNYLTLCFVRYALHNKSALPERKDLNKKLKMILYICIFFYTRKIH